MQTRKSESWAGTAGRGLDEMEDMFLRGETAVENEGSRWGPLAGEASIDKHLRRARLG